MRCVAATSKRPTVGLAGLIGTGNLAGGSKFQNRTSDLFHQIEVIPLAFPRPSSAGRSAMAKRFQQIKTLTERLGEFA
jgi:hypothetical protein